MGVEERMMLAVYRLPLWCLTAVFLACFAGSYAWFVITQTPGGLWVVVACLFGGLPFYVCAVRKWRLRRGLC